MRRLSTFVTLALLVCVPTARPAAAQIVPGTAPGTFVGPSSTQTPYVVPLPAAPGWETLAVISVADPAENGYTMVGIPDGLGALAGKFRAGQYIVERASLTPPGQTEPSFAQFDNITVDGDGAVLIQEDPGNTPYIARTWRVDPTTKTAMAILQSDPARFGPPPTAPFNVDEESSGIIEVTDLVRSARWYQHGRRYFLADLQAHYSLPGEFVEGGQLYLVASPKRHRHAFHNDEDRDHDREDRDDHRR